MGNIASLSTMSKIMNSVDQRIDVYKPKKLLLVVVYI